MYNEAARIIELNKETLAKKVTDYVKDNFPHRTMEYDKCTRDVGHILNSLVFCLDDGNTDPIEHVSRMFFHRGKLQLKSVYVEFQAYDFMLREIDNLVRLQHPGAYNLCITAIAMLKYNLTSETVPEHKDNTFENAANIIKDQTDNLAKQISDYVQENFPYRTREPEKCTRDVAFILNAIETCLRQNNNQHIDYISRMFFKGADLQLKSTEVEFHAYDKLLSLLNPLLSHAEPDSFEFCEKLIARLKHNLEHGFEDYQGNGFKNRSSNRETMIKRMFYNWDNEMEIIRNMQKCQRNWDYSREVHPEVIDYLLWHAENAPSKQHEAYYDVYWSADRKIIDEASKYTWGSTHSRNPPSTWRNTQANANMYMLFVAKQPETQLNCNADGTLKDNAHHARWENSYVSIGIAMGLVMRAAHSLGYVTGCNKSHGDLNGNMYWERLLGIEEDVLAGHKKIAYGIGIGFPQEGRPRWETDDYELAIGSGNGSHLTTLTEDDPEWRERRDLPKPWDKRFRKIKIVDIRTTDKAVDPYGVEHDIPSESSIKINTMRKRIINVTEIK